MARQQPIELFMPPNMLKAKVGSGAPGLDLAAIKRAETAMEEMRGDFAGWAAADVDTLMAARARFRKSRTCAWSWDKGVTGLAALRFPAGAPQRQLGFLPACAWDVVFTMPSGPPPPGRGTGGGQGGRSWSWHPVMGAFYHARGTEG